MEQQTTNVTVLPPTSAPWWAKMGGVILDKPGGLAIIFSIVLLAMMLGILPSTLSTAVDNIDQKVDNLAQDNVNIERKIDTAVAVAADKDADMIKLLRGICIIMSKNDQQAALQYCNP